MAAKRKADRQHDDDSNQTRDPERDSEESSASETAPDDANDDVIDASVVDDELDEEEEEDDELEGDDDAFNSLPAESSPHSLAKLDAMAAYIRETQRHPLLSPEETFALATEFQKTQDPALAARLVTSNLRLVVKIAYKYRRAYKNIMDLVQEGNIGLMQAVKRYDPYRGVKLSSYAAYWIRAYIMRFILNNWRLVKLGTTQAQRKLFFNLRKTTAELAAKGIDVTHADIARELNVPENDVAEMDVRLSSNEASLDAPVGDADGRSISRVDMMASGNAGPETLIARNELQDLLKDKLHEFRKTLLGKEKELAIFDERLVADDPLTLQELGDRFSISRERVRQLEQRVTSRLREYLRDEVGGDAVDSF